MGVRGPDLRCFPALVTVAPSQQQPSSLPSPRTISSCSMAARRTITVAQPCAQQGHPAVPTEYDLTPPQEEQKKTATPKPTEMPKPPQSRPEPPTPKSTRTTHPQSRPETPTPKSTRTTQPPKPTRTAQPPKPTRTAQPPKPTRNAQATPRIRAENTENPDANANRPPKEIPSSPNLLAPQTSPDTHSPRRPNHALHGPAPPFIRNSRLHPPSS